MIVDDLVKGLENGSTPKGEVLKVEDVDLRIYAPGAPGPRIVPYLEGPYYMDDSKPLKLWRKS